MRNFNFHSLTPWLPLGAAGKLVKVTGRFDELDNLFVDIIATDAIIQVKTTYKAIRRAALRWVNPSTLANPDRVKLYLSTTKQIAREAASTELPYKIVVQKGQLASFPQEVKNFAQEARMSMQVAVGDHKCNASGLRTALTLRVRTSTLSNHVFSKVLGQLHRTI